MPNYNLQHSQAPARITEAQAIQTVKNSGWSPNLFSHSYTVEYGSYTFGQRTTAPEGGSLAGPVDVWKLTFTGLNIPRPAGRAGAPAASQPPPVTTLVLWVDDKAGVVLGADGY